MKRYLRRLFAENVFFWKLWFRIANRNKKSLSKKFFNNETDCYIGGYQRSGNTFIAHLVKQVFPDIKFVHHLHKVAIIKESLNRKLPTYILIRDPKGAIPSMYMKYFSQTTDTLPEQVDLDVLKKYTEDYYWYYRYVSKKKQDLNIIQFDHLIKDPKNAVLQFKPISNTSDSENTLKDKCQIAEDNYVGATTKLGSSRPSKYKEDNKIKLRKSLEQLEYFKKSQAVYQQIVG